MRVRFSAEFRRLALVSSRRAVRLGSALRPIALLYRFIRALQHGPRFIQERPSCFCQSHRFCRSFEQLESDLILQIAILLFHVLMNPAGLGPGVLAAILWGVVFASVRSAFVGIFQARAEMR